MKSNSEYDRYNQFAACLIRRVAERAQGADEDSKRIYDVYPSEHILTGFLTASQGDNSHAAPTDSAADGASEDEGTPIPDLPQDEYYEQTAIGLEWSSEHSLIRTGQTLEVIVSFAVYVRRLPTRAEQSVASWKIDRRKPANAISSPAPQKFADLRPVWTREQLAPVTVRLDLAKILQQRRHVEPLGEQVGHALSAIDTSNLLPTYHAPRVQESDLQSEQSWEQWCLRQQTNQIPVRWSPCLDIRVIESRVEPGQIRFALRLINRTATGSGDFADPNLYGVKMSVSVPSSAWRPTIFNELLESYRYDRHMPAIGINAHVMDEEVGDRKILRIDSVPMQIAHRLEPRAITAEPTFVALANDPLSILRAINDEMKRYDRKDWHKKIDELSNEFERLDAEAARNDFGLEIKRFERGIALLSDNRYPLVRQAFVLMNRAMLRQQEIEGFRYDQWRLFQIVFIVSQLPDLAAREYAELATGEEGLIEILWFAAGGGKTEAFLGLMIWQAFFDRLRGKKFGTTAFVRFPLRLLAFQQLQRLGRAFAAAELIRQEMKLGGARFSLGYFVGSALTPNKIDDKAHRRFQETQVVDEHLQLFQRCPFCAEQVKLGYEVERRLVQHLCANDDCPGGKKPLPVYVVDWDIYRYLPTVVVSTVDKLAQLGQNQRFANLFGRFDLLCHQHGASFQGVNGKDDFCEAAKQFGALQGIYQDGTGNDRRPKRCGKHPVETKFHDPAPALLIQDELHLLSEELGTFDAHYETAAMEMMRAFGTGNPWKVVAATATIKEFENHAWQLYLQHARQFPAPGPEAYESFYYTQNKERIGRIFIGLLGVGRKHTAAVTRLLSLVYLELEQARASAENDPVATCQRYGLLPMSSEELKQLVFNYELVLTYVLTRKGSDQVAEAIETRVKKELTQLAPAHDDDLIVTTFNGSADPAQMKKTLDDICEANEYSNPSERVRGIVTTNIIGHGVDVDRFNVIVFSGFTRHAAEYIQASARVGRRYPGISILVPTPQSERDRSIFDRFVKFHEYLDRLVDASAINRWPEAALRKTLPGILSGYLMGVAAHRLKQPLAMVNDVYRNYGKPHADALQEQEIQEWLRRAYGQSFALSPQKFDEELYKQMRLAYNLIDKLRPQSGSGETINGKLNAMQSLRDVDAPADISVAPEDDPIIRRLING